MFMDTPETLLYVAGGGFLLGWFVGKIGAYFGNKIQERNRDPRDDRLRSMNAELRIAQTDAGAIQESHGRTGHRGGARQAHRRAGRYHNSA
jgi:hypothetical protein